jgi:transposase
VLKANRAELAAIVNDLAPRLTDRYGIGPVSAAQAIVSFSHAGWCRNDAAFAKLAGTSPIEASSGQTTRHRLNRGRDRALNKAILCRSESYRCGSGGVSVFVDQAVEDAGVPRCVGV